MKRSKNIILFAAILLLFLGCGAAPESEPFMDSPSAYHHTKTSLGVSANFEFAGNGQRTVARVYGYPAFENGLYALTVEGDSISYQKFAEDPLDYASLLGMDGDGNAWISGFDDSDVACVQQVSPDGTVLLTLTFDGPPYSFTWDESYYYLLLDDYAFGVYDHHGNEVFKENISEYSSATLGYLGSIEEEWMEELDGRDGDVLYEMLFPAGPSDTFQLIRLRDGTPAMIIRRDAPIGDDTYDIICTIDQSDFSVTPVGYYPVDTYETDRVAILIESVDEPYDLMVAGLDGMFGVDITKGTTTPLLSWEDMSYPMTNNAPKFPHSAVATSVGILMQHNEFIEGQSATFWDLFAPQ